MLFVTLTAPGDEAHLLRDGGICPCTPVGGIVVARFNATAAKRFNRWVQEMRRQYGPIEYAKATEVQTGTHRRDGVGRGAVHFHVFLRAEDEARILADYRKNDPWCPLREIAERHGFGHEMDVAVPTIEVAWYAAKYASKSAAERASMPWMDLMTGEISQGNGRYRAWTASRGWGVNMREIRLAQAAWARENRGAAEGGALDSNTESYTGQPSNG